MGEDGFSRAFLYAQASGRQTILASYSIYKLWTIQNKGEKYVQITGGGQL
jgi:hypothetical protein